MQRRDRAEISDIAATDNEDGTLTITFKTTGAKSAGVQVYAGEAPASMPDTYRADAKQYARTAIPSPSAG